MTGDGNARVNQFLDRKKNGLLAAQEILFSLNLAWAIGNAFFVYTLRSLASWVPLTDPGYYFRRSAVRINDLLHLNSINAVSTERVAREAFSQMSQVGEEITYSVSILGAAVLIFLLYRLSARRFACQAVLSRVAGAVVLFAAPTCYLLMEKLTWNWAYGRFLPGVYRFWWSPHVAVLGGEILCFSVLLIVERRRSISLGTLCVLLALHYTYWLPALWPGEPMYPHRLFSPYLFIVVFPMSGLVWLLCTKTQGASGAEVTARRRVGRWTVATAIIAVVAVMLVWLPPREFSLTHDADIKSLTIQLSRGPCYGRCPSYTITIHGNGLLEYVGGKYARIACSQTEIVSNEQVTQILQQLDRAHFFALEDRAFMWCFDSSSLSISVLVDGKSKRVISDGGCVGSKSGQQAQFVRAADNIDTIVGSERWVRCENARCWN